MNDLVLITTQLKVAEMAKVVYEEKSVYTKEELLADIGGALGLILGLNLLDVLVFSGSLCKMISRKIVNAYTYIIRGGKVICVATYAYL